MSGESILFSKLRENRLYMRNTAAVMLFICVTGLSIFGIVMLYSTSSALFGEEKLIKQTQWIGIGMLCACGLYFFDYRILCRHRVLLLACGIIPLLYLASAFVMSKVGVPNAVLSHLPFVRKVNGAYRWLFIGPFSIQPGELGKLAVIIFLAGYYGSHPRRSRQFLKGVLVPLVGVGMLLGPLLLGGSLSITMITCAVIFTMMFAAGVRLRYFFAMISCAVILVLLVLIISPERMKRVTGSWFEPEKYSQREGYQLTHSQYAIGSGSWTGVGLNNSRMKEGYLPYSWTDFIMAIVAEELGFVGIVSVMGAFLLLVASAFWISSLAADRQGLLLGVGIGFSIGFHALTNLAVVSGALPTTGVTVPLISYGGSNMLLTWLGIGLLGSIARVAHREELAGLSVYHAEPVENILATEGVSS